MYYFEIYKISSLCLYEMNQSVPLPDVLNSQLYIRFSLSKKGVSDSQFLPRLRKTKRRQKMKFSVYICIKESTNDKQCLIPVKELPFSKTIHERWVFLGYLDCSPRRPMTRIAVPSPVQNIISEVQFIAVTLYIQNQWLREDWHYFGGTIQGGLGRWSPGNFEI